MKRTATITVLKKLEKQAESITDSIALAILDPLFNLVEMLMDQNENHANEIQQLRNAINKLKGEQGQPKIRPQSKDNNTDHSSEEERKKRQPLKPHKKGGSKKAKVQVNRVVTLTLAPSDIPEGFHRNGILKRVFQDIHFGADNVEFQCESYYNPETGDYLSAQLPKGYNGDYGPGIQSFVKTAYSYWGVTLKNILSMLSCMNIDISNATISRMITGSHKLFGQEKEDIIKAGLQSSSYQHLDDTSGREKGKNRYVHILANPWYTAYFTLQRKDRLSIVEMLSVGKMQLLLDEKALLLMAQLGVAQCYRSKLKDASCNMELSRQAMTAKLSIFLPSLSTTKRAYKLIIEACAISAYQSSSYAITQLIVDDAPQFKAITEERGLCWIHEGRHYKKMRPLLSLNQKKLDQFLKQYWDYYYELLDYKDKNSKELQSILSGKFDDIFSQETGYDKLDKQLRLILKKKDELLLVLKYPFIPLHNNTAELGARIQARGRDIHLHTMSEAGTKAKDILATLSETANKLSVNVFDYFYDRIIQKYEMPSLASLIKERSAVMRC
jgi:hypothetical protein